ncbi:hypothetical protein [Brachybacterium sp.]|uniref:hypothetical protein n=1 Tax=Brachybacterium sp. TaxID=1891286 RepID=UPI003F8E6CFB
MGARAVVAEAAWRAGVARGPRCEVGCLAYFDWSARSFRLATSGAAAATQLHAHFCCSEFPIVVDAIDALGADVTSVESARSRGELFESLEPDALPRGCRPRRVGHPLPARARCRGGRRAFAPRLRRGRPQRLWGIPDCGLKARDYVEAEVSLPHPVPPARKASEVAVVPAGD